MLRLATLLAAAAVWVPAAALDPAATAALEYLRTTTHETGVDVLVAVEVYGALADDPRAAEVVRQARARVPPAELERFAMLLGADKPPFPAAPAPEPLGTANPVGDASDDRARTCPLEVLSCAVSEACVAFSAGDASGKTLTHQALWLVFAHWRGCELPVDVDALRRRYAARLIAEARADPEPSDLFFERLAMLGHLGFGAAIEPGWIEAARASQRPEGCFPPGPSAPCHPHSTALALWALAPRRGAPTR